MTAAIEGTISNSLFKSKLSKSVFWYKFLIFLDSVIAYFIIDFHRFGSLYFSVVFSGLLNFYFQ